MSGFRIYQADYNGETPFLFMPASAITPKIGMALLESSGKLAIAAGTNKPEYISMYESDEALAAGDVIPVIKVNAGEVFKVYYASAASLTVGAAYTIASGGLTLTTTTTSGVFTVERIDTDKLEVYGRFL